MLYVNDIPISVTIFPDNTSQVWKLPDSILKASPVAIAQIKWVFEHEGEFLHLAQLKRLLNYYGYCISLYMPYLPYGRQDKNIDNNSTFALGTFTFLLNSLNFLDITCLDPHSDVAQGLINHFRPIYPAKLVEQIAQLQEGTIFCYPDAGALKKYSEVYAMSYRPHIYGEKVRDQLTGNILSYKLVGDPSGKNVLIVDDICDGGMTFKILAKDLLAAEANSVVLFVTHGIFSKGLKTLFDSGIQRIFTHDGEAFEDQGQIIYRKI